MELEMKLKIAVREVIAECSDWVRMDKTTWFEVEDMLKNKIKCVLSEVSEIKKDGDDNEFGK